MSKPATAPRSARKFFPSPPLSLVIFAFWLLLSDELGAGALVFGVLLALVVPVSAARLDREFARIGSLRPVPKMLLVVAVDILLSNIKVALQVLGPERNLTPGFIWLPLDIANIHGITALTSMITLTPGTVSVALSDDRRHLLIHVLHLTDPQALIADIKRRYEKPLMAIFP